MLHRERGWERPRVQPRGAPRLRGHGKEKPTRMEEEEQLATREESQGGRHGARRRSPGRREGRTTDFKGVSNWNAGWV